MKLSCTSVIQKKQCLVSVFIFELSVCLSLSCSHLSFNESENHFSQSSVSPTRDQSKYRAINKVKNVVCFLSCRKYFCKYVESIKYLLDSASFDDSDKTIMYRGICVDKMWLCNLCTFATRLIKVLFSYFKNLILSCLSFAAFLAFVLCDALLL